MLPFTLLVLLLICITSPSSTRLSFTLWVRLWGRVFCTLTPLRIRVRGLENIAPNQPYVLVANHASQYDIPIIAGWLPLDIKWVGKMELKNTLIVGTAGKALGAVWVDRANKEAAIQSLEGVKSRLTGSTSIIFFPEGTRSKIGKMLPFKRGAFVMAKDLALPVLPISVVNSDQILPSGAWLPRAGTVELCIHPAIPVAEVAQLPLPDLTDKAQTIVGSALTRET